MRYRLALAAAVAASAVGLPAPAAPPAEEAPAPAPEREQDPRGEWLQKLLEDLRKRRNAPAPEGGGVPVPDRIEEDEKERADPIQTLEEAAKLMAEAEEHLYAAAAKKGLAKGTAAAEKLKPPDGQPPPDGGGSGQALQKMKQAQEKIEKLLGNADKKQQDTIDLINLLIRQARRVQMQSQQQQQQRQRQQQQQRPRNQPQNQPNARNPAERPYAPPPSREGSGSLRTADRADRWGDLPPHMRDETNQGLRQVEEFPAEYRELLQEYYKRLSGGD